MAPYTGTWEFCPGVTVTEDRQRALIRAAVSAPCLRWPMVDKMLSSMIALSPPASGCPEFPLPRRQGRSRDVLRYSWLKAAEETGSSRQTGVLYSDSGNVGRIAFQQSRLDLL